MTGGNVHNTICFFYNAKLCRYWNMTDYQRIVRENLVHKVILDCGAIEATVQIPIP